MAEMLSWFSPGLGHSLGSLGAVIAGLVVLGVYNALAGSTTRTRVAFLYRKDERGDAVNPIRFTIILEPKSQKRARSRGFIVKGGGKHGQDIARAQTYTDEDQRTEQNKLMALMYEHRPPVPFQGPVALGMRAFLPIPKSKSKKWQAAAMAGEIRPTTRPDTDNLVKQLKDCANGVFWEDDKQIVGLHAEKWYAEIPRWEVEIVPCESNQGTQLGD